MRIESGQSVEIPVGFLGQELSSRSCIGTDIENKKKNFLEESEKTMTDLGVTRIFKQLRDDNKVVWNTIISRRGITLFNWSRYTQISEPARIVFGDNSISVSLCFDYDFHGEDEYVRSVTVTQNDNGDYFVQSGDGRDYKKMIENKNNIPNLINEAIIIAKAKPAYKINSPVLSDF